MLGAELVNRFDRLIDYISENTGLHDNPKFFLECGNIYLQQGALDRALEEYDRAIRFNPNYAEALTNRGNAFNRSHQYDRAIRDLDRAITLNPHSAEAFTNRGAAHLGKSEYDCAIEDFDRAIKLDPNDAGTFKG